MVVLSLKEELGVDDLPDEIRDYSPIVESDQANNSMPKDTSQPRTLEELERQLVESTLAKCVGNKKKAADLMGISRSAFYEKLKKYGIDG
jgi:DNA-binding NtrC family response regulator